MDVTLDLDTFIKIVGGLIAFIGFFLAIKFGVNGLRADIKEIKADVKAMRAANVTQNERLGNVEARMEERKGWVRRIEEQLSTLSSIVERRLVPRD